MKKIQVNQKRISEIMQKEIVSIWKLEGGSEIVFQSSSFVQYKPLFFRNEPTNWK